METLNGITIKRQDLKKEGGNYIFFEQLEDLLKKSGQSTKTELNDRLFDKYESLVINSEDELVGVKGKQTERLGKIKGAFAAAQTLFSE